MGCRELQKMQVVVSERRGTRSFVRAAKAEKKQRLAAVAQKLRDAMGALSGKQGDRLCVAVGVDQQMDSSARYYIAQVHQVFQAKKERRVGSKGAYWTISKDDWCARVVWAEPETQFYCDGDHDGDELITG